MTGTVSTRALLETWDPRRLRRAGLLYVACTLPLVALAGLLIHTEHQYLMAYVLLSSGIYTTPAFASVAVAIRRAEPADRWHWWMWLAALACIYTTGAFILVVIASGGDPRGPAVGVGFVIAVWVFLVGAAGGLARARSGKRAISVDFVEWLIYMIAIAAPAVLVWGPTVVESAEAWWVVPAALSALGMVSGCFWTILLYVRLRREGCRLERLGIAFSLVGLVNAVLQTAQGLSGFTLPAAPLLALNGLCMAFLLLVPLHALASVSVGLERLPPQNQVRGAGVAPVVVLAGTPVLLIVTVLLHERRPWAVPFALGAAMVLLILAAVRQLLAVRETRRLYAQVEQASDERRDLLARVIRRIDEDRHAVAAQLHEQAMSAYATFVSYLLASSRTMPIGERASVGALAEASALVRDDLSRQAEALRQLMLAVGPLEASRQRSEGLEVPIQAYVHSLYADRQPPTVEVAVAPNLVLDWITETIVLRIIQEALRNVWRHSKAHRVDVSLTIIDALVDLRVADDGTGFDPSAGLYESGIAAMRSFAAFANGGVQIDSSPGRGTVVRARLGAVGGNGGSRQRSTGPAGDVVSPETARPRTYR
jgi:signal transduction histidine kinase